EYNLVRKEGNNLFAEVFLKNLFDGRGAYVFVKASPLYDDKGNIVGAIESIRDITERKEIEQDLKESEEKYRWLFEVSPLYLILVGLDGRLMDVNQAACDFVGTSKEDLMAKHFSELGIMPEEELPLHYDNVTRILKGEEIEPYESKYIDKNGEIHFAVTHESPIKKDGEVIAFQIICVDTTERKKMEEALKEEKEFAENLIETANVIVLGLDPEGKVNIFNSAAEEITGYSSEEVLGNSFELILPRERYGYVWSKFYNLMEGGMPKYFENPILTKSGEERFITWQNNELYKDGQIIGSISFGMDVTDRKNAEKALLESEEKYRDLIELLPQPVYESDLDGNITFANRVGLDIFGYTREDMDKGLNMAQILSPQDHLKAMEDILKTLDGEELVSEYNAVKKDGTIFPVVVYASPIIHENKVTGSRGIVIDTTELKRQEQELELINKNLMVSEERFRALIDNTTSIIRILDKDGLIVFDSPSSSRILGYPEGYFIGKNPIDYIHPQDRLNAKDALKEVFEYRNDGIPTEFRIKKADGTYHPFESIAQNLTGEPGIEGILIVTNSIFRRKKYEDKIKKSLKEKNVLLQEIHHRVKNNMQIISSLLNLQKEHVNSGEAINVLQESQNRVKSMALIHEKLYKSDNLMNINLKDYIQDLITDLFHSYGVSKEEVVPICDMEDIMLNVETAIPCGLIVSELVSNSLKYAFPPNIREFQEKKGEIFVGLKSVGDFIQLRIYDNGIGFPEGRDYNNLDTLGLRLVNVL
ncbi:MAG: PAS domain S-box protein, partial [Methanobacterium sp.]